MAENFLAQLPRVSKEELPDDSVCIICHEEYGTAPSDSEPAEEAVCLPCPGKHIVGLACISSWLSSDTHRYSCPYCRHEFPALTNPDQLQARQRIGHWVEQWYMLPARLESQGATLTSMRRWNAWFTEWATVAINMSEEDLSLARTARTSLFTRTGWSQLPANTDMVLWSDIDTSIELEPLASAIRTRHFRECWLYLPHCAENGPRRGLLGEPVSQLNFEQEAAVLRYLCRTGAFRVVLEEVENKSERWQILRSLGYTFDEDRRIWAAYPF